MTRKLLPFVLLVLAALGAIAWFVARRAVSPSMERADDPRAAAALDASVELEEGQQPLAAARLAEKGEEALPTGPGGTKTLEPLVDSGRAITGRVVDDRGLPCPDVSVRQRVRPEETVHGRVTSGPDGRFRIENASYRSAGVYVLELWRGRVVMRTQFEGGPEKDVDVGDIVLPREAIYAGHVVDARGEPVAGALLSLRPGRDRSRADGPLPSFELKEGEQLTDAEGRFETRGNSLGFMVFVQTRAGQSQKFKLPKLEPGERKDDVELRLDPLTWIELELVDARGELVRGPARPDTSGAIAVVAVDAYDKSGSSKESRAPCDPDGIWRVDVRCEAADIDVLEVTVAGYQRIHDEVGGTLAPGARRRYVLAELPSFRVRLLQKDADWKPLRAPGAEVEIHLCLASPALRSGRHWSECCGFGASWRGRWLGEPREFVLDVKRSAPFWIYAGARDSHEQVHTAASFGPFEPGDQVRELALDPRMFLPQAAPAAAREDRPAPVVPASQVVHRGRILREDGEPLSEAYLLVRAAGSVGARFENTARTAADGSFEIKGELPERMQLRISRRARRDLTGPFELQLFALERWPAEEVLELRVAKFRSVVVAVQGLDADASELIPFICPAPGEPTANCDHWGAVVPEHLPLELGSRLPSAHAGPQRYAFVLAPGRYQVWGSNLMHELVVTDLDVTAGEGDLELAVEVK